MEIRWNYEKLSGNKDYEELKRSSKSFRKQASTKAQNLLLQRLDLLIDQVIQNDDINLRDNMINKVNTWFKSHIGNFEVPEDPQPEKPRRPTFSRIKIKKSVKTPEKKERLRNLDDYRFLQSKEKQIKRWGMERSRSEEDFHYKSELKSLSFEKSPMAKGLNPGFYSKKLLTLCNKYKFLIDSTAFNAEKKYPEQNSSAFLPSIRETEDLKRRLANKSFGVSFKTIEPMTSFIESPSRVRLGKVTGNPELSPLNLPSGGERLMKGKIKL